MGIKSLNQDSAQYIYKIKSILKNNAHDTIGLEMLDKFESGEWILNKQEFHYIDKNPEIIYPYLQYRYRFWKLLNAPDYEQVSSFPLYLGIEPTSVCNLRCQMCWQREDAIRTKPYSGKMDLSLFKKIIDEAHRGGCCAITLAGRGEPLINPEICSFLDYAANKFYELKINTNGLLLNDKVSHAILKSNVSLVVFSAEGTTQDIYEKTRCGGDFSQLIKNIRRFNDIRKNYYKDSKTQTRVSGVIVDNSMNKEDYYNFWKTLVDEVALVDMEERWDTYGNKVFSVNVHPCNRLWHQMYIWWDGSCAVCDNDYLTKIQIGKLDTNQTIQDLWNGQEYAKIRRLHFNGRRNECFPCDRCGL